MSFGIGGSRESSSSTLDQLMKNIFSQSTTQNQTEAGTSNVSTSQTGTQSGSTVGETGSDTRRVLAPEQQAVMPQLQRIITALSTNPREFYAPQQNVAREEVNENYAGLGDTLRQQFMGGGEGSSGKYGRAVLQADLARRGDLSKVDNGVAVQAAQAPLTAAQLAQNFLGINFGETSKGNTRAATTGSTTNTGTSVGTTTGTTAGTVNTTGSSEEQKTAVEKGTKTGVKGSFGF